MNRSPRGRGPKRGSALIVALAMLTLFALMGTAYVKHVSLRAEENNIDLRKIHAETASEAGISAAIGKIATILERGGRVPADAQQFELPVYGMVKTDVHPEVNQGLELVNLEQRGTMSTVTITDESGKVNINHAPASVLRHLLGGDGATARRLAELAREKPFISLDELMERGELNEEQFAQLEPYVTVYTVVEHDDPAGYINLRAASRPVLAALFDLADEQAVTNIESRVPTTLEELCVLAGNKNPATFNIPMDPNSPDALPPALSLTSRCFRLVSEGSFVQLEDDGSVRKGKGAAARVEAVVLFGLDGAYEILKWTTQAIT